MTPNANLPGCEQGNFLAVSSPRFSPSLLTRLTVTPAPDGLATWPRAWLATAAATRKNRTAFITCKSSKPHMRMSCKARDV